MIDLKQVRFIIGVIESLLIAMRLISFFDSATVITIGLHALPMPKYISIYENKSVGEDTPHHSIVIVRHCMLCVFYGLPFVHKDGIFLSTVCLFVLVIEATYLTIFFISCRDKKNLREYIVLNLVAVIIFVVAIVLITLFAIESSFAKQTFVGVICVVSYIMCTIGAPLLSFKKAVETKSVEHIPLCLYFVNLIHSGIWTAYSLIYIIDLYAVISNGLGTMLYASQLIVYAIYYKSTPKVKTE